MRFFVFRDQLVVIEGARWQNGISGSDLLLKLCYCPLDPFSWDDATVAFAGLM